MIVRVPIETEIRSPLSWHERWKGPDDGLIACWERGRELSVENSQLASAAAAGQLPTLPFKGGVEGALVSKRKAGTLYYYAMWLGLRNESLEVDTSKVLSLTCTKWGVTVSFSADPSTYRNA